MKIRKSTLGVIFVLAISVLIGSWATGEEAYVTKESEEYCGTWVNTDYRKPDVKGDHYWKLINNPDGTFEMYGLVSISTRKADVEGNYSIAEKWTDSKGNIRYKVSVEWKAGDRFYSLYPTPSQST